MNNLTVNTQIKTALCLAEEGEVIEKWQAVLRCGEYALVTGTYDTKDEAILAADTAQAGAGLFKKALLATMGVEDNE